MPILEAEPSVFPLDLLTDDGIFDDERSWWAVYTKSRQEKSLARQLSQHEIPFFLPLVGKDNLIRGKRVRSYLPLFNGYLFLYGSEDERYTTLTTNRISRILPVEDQHQLRMDLRNVWELIDRDAPMTIESKLEAGDPVRIKSGSLEGLEGTVIKRHGMTRLLVAVNYLQQGVSVQIDDFMLEKL